MAENQQNQVSPELAYDPNPLQDPNWQNNPNYTGGKSPFDVGRAYRQWLDRQQQRERQAAEQRQTVQNTLQSDAQNFRKDLPVVRQQQMAGLIPTFQIAEQQGVKRTKENYARRGLLYSGKAVQDVTSVRGQVASEMAKSRQEINKETEKIALAKEQAAIATALDARAQLLQTAEMYYNLNQQNQIERRRAAGAIAQGLGYAAGAYYGNKTNKDVPAFSEYNSTNFAQPTEYGLLLGVNYEP